jgi:hypothetical protein
MKTQSILAIAMGLTTMVVLNSCEPVSTVTPPLVTVNPAEAVTAKPGDTVTYQMLINSDTELKTASMVVKFNSTVVASKDSTFPAGLEAAIINYGFIVPETMADGSVLSATFTAANTEQTVVSRTINIVIPPGEIFTYTAVIMADLENPNVSSFYSAEDNKLMNINAAIAASAEVDLIYYYGATNKATLCAPADLAVEAFDDSHGDPIVLKFATRNNTKLSLVTMTAAEFTAVANDLTIKAKQPAATATAAPNLAVNNVIWCETVTGKKGLILVKNITGTQSSSLITIEVKIQK